MLNTPDVACEFALPSGSAMRPSATMGLFQWPLPDGEIGDLASRRWIVHSKVPPGSYTNRSPAGDDWARPCVRVAPRSRHVPGAVGPRCCCAAISGEEPGRAALPSDGGRGEELAPRGRTDRLRFPALVCRRPDDCLQVEHADCSVLSALRDVGRVEEHRRRRADVGVASLESARYSSACNWRALAWRARRARSPRHPSS